MAYLTRLLLVIAIAAEVLCEFNPVVPTLNEDEWWGPGSVETQDTSIREFSITWTPKLIQDLKSRLCNYRPLVDPLAGVGFEDGFNTIYLKTVVKFWKDEYDFTSRVNYLNQFPQYKTNIQGLDIHYIHVKPNVTDQYEVVPLLLLHGWPGSVREFYEAIPLLTTPKDGKDFVFEVIVPSLPGFGFSDAAIVKGLGTVEIGVIMKHLMERIGHDQFYIQGGDMGSIIGHAMTVTFPQSVLGYHTNMPIALSTAFKEQLAAGENDTRLDKSLRKRIYPTTSTQALKTSESGYSALQSTKPDTIGIAVSQSPVSLAAYHLEKFATGANLDNINRVDGGLPSLFTLTELIDNLMFYWTENKITTSFRLYKEMNSAKTVAYKINEQTTTVPVWALHTAHDPLIYPALFMNTTYPNLLHISIWNIAGHYAALEAPQEFADDVWTAIEAFRTFHKK